MGQVLLKLEEGGVDSEVNASRQVDTELAEWNKDSLDVGLEGAQSNGGSHASESRANANRAELGEVFGVFVQGNKVEGREGGLGV